MTAVPRTRLRAWFQLLRPPNLFTVPGDPLMGYLLANPSDLDWSLAWAVLASLCLYCAGLLMNDLADQAEDRRERPARPLPSGAVRPGPVWGATALLGGAGLLAAWVAGGQPALLCSLAVLAAIALYNFVTKKWPIVGALN